MAMCEYFMEARLIPVIKGLAFFRLLGLAGMMFGEFFRKGALIQVCVCACVCVCVCVCVHG